MITATSTPAKYKTELQGATAMLTMDVATAAGGSGEGLTPFELLLSGFVSCYNITLRKLMEKRGLAYRRVVVTADEDREAEPGTMCIKWQAEIDADLDEAQKQELLARAFAKCPVHNALSGKIIFQQQ